MRRCDKCRGELPGPKGHGFVSDDGKTLQCSGCEFPHRKKKTTRRRGEASSGKS